MMLTRAWSHKLSAMAGLAAMLTILLWPAIPLRSLSVWFKTLTSLFPTNVFYPILAILIGSYVAFYVYDRKVAKCCLVRSAKTSSLSSIGGVLLGACPACIPVLGFFLPLSLTITLSYYSWIILLVSVALMSFSLWRAGAFSKVKI